jgi:modulator of FtsH protease HflC
MNRQLFFSPPVLVAGLILALVVGRQTIFTVSQWEQALIIQLGQFKRTIQEPGLHWKIPFVQQLHKLEKRILSSDSESSEYLTLDRKRVLVNHVTRWRINDPLRFYITVREEVGARARLDDLVFSELRREIASRDFGELIAAEREPAMEAVAKRAAERAKQFGIEVVDVRIKRADLPTEVQASVFARMVAERERIAKRYRSEGSEEAAKIRADTDKERTIILAKAYEGSQRARGKGDGEATRIYGAEFGKDPEFYGFTRSLEAYERFLGEKSTVLLSPDSRLLRYLTDAKATR